MDIVRGQGEKIPYERLILTSYVVSNFDIINLDDSRVKFAVDGRRSG